MEKLLLIGAYTVAKEIKEFVEKYKLFDIIGYSVNQRFIKDETIDGLPVIPLEEIEHHISKKTKLYMAISWGQRLNQVRKDIYNDLKSKGYSFANLISPLAVIMTDDIGEGNLFYEFSYIGHGVKIGNNNEFRAFCTIGHYTTVGSHNHFSKCTVGGKANIGDCNFVGMQAVLYNRISVGNKNFIGACSIVKKDLTSFNLIAAKESETIGLSEKQIENIVVPGGKKNFLS